MAKQEKHVIEPAKEKAVVVSGKEKEMVELTLGHPSFNPKSVQRYEVTAKLAAKGVKSGHWKIVD